MSDSAAVTAKLCRGGEAVKAAPTRRSPRRRGGRRNRRRPSARKPRTLEALERQHSHSALLMRSRSGAHAIHEWPIDERTVVWVITIATSVIAAAIGRLILDPLGAVTGAA
jgi:hypothetical protein